MMAREIPPQYVGKVDQDLTAARANLRLHLADFERWLSQGDAPETVFAGFAQAMARDTNLYHVSVMFSAAVLTLFEERRSGQDRLQEFTFRAGFRVTVIRHGRCGWFQAVHNDLGGDLAKFSQLALEHLQECEA